MFALRKFAIKACSAVEDFLQIDVSRDGRFVVAASSLDCSLSLWCMKSGEEIWRYSHKSFVPVSPTFSWDGQQIVDVSHNFEVVVFNSSDARISMRRSHLQFESYGMVLHHAIFNCDSSLIFVGSCEAIGCHSVADGTQRWSDEYQFDSCCVGNNIGTNDGHVFHNSANESITARNASTGEVLLTADSGIEELSCIALSARADRIACGGGSGKIRILTTDTGESVLLINAYDSWIESIDWSPCSRYVAVSDGAKNVGIWDSVTGQKLTGIELEATALQTRFNPTNSNELICGLDNSTIHILGVESL